MRQQEIVALQSQWDVDIQHAAIGQAVSQYQDQLRSACKATCNERDQRAPTIYPKVAGPSACAGAIFGWPGNFAFHSCF